MVYPLMLHPHYTKNGLADLKDNQCQILIAVGVLNEDVVRDNGSQLNGTRDLSNLRPEEKSPTANLSAENRSSHMQGCLPDVSTKQCLQNGTLLDSSADEAQTHSTPTYLEKGSLEALQRRFKNDFKSCLIPAEANALRDQNFIHYDQMTLPVLHPPTLAASHISSDGKHYINIKVRNTSYDDIEIVNLQVTAKSAREGLDPQDFEDSLWCDPLQHTSKNDATLNQVVDMRLMTKCLPLTLSNMEVQSVMFEMLPNKDTIESCSNEAYILLLNVSWSTRGSPGPDLSPITTCYRLCDIQIRKPGFSVTAVPESQMIQAKERFQIKYTISNSLQDFQQLRLLWSPEKVLRESKAKENPDYRRSIQQVMTSVVCHQPIVDLGPCPLGSNTAVSVDFQVLAPGVYELGQHMKLNLQYVSNAVAPITSNSASYAFKPAYGRERRGSTTSVRSMPAGPLSANGAAAARSPSQPQQPRLFGTPQFSRKSASLSPVSLGGGMESPSAHERPPLEAHHGDGGSGGFSLSAPTQRPSLGSDGRARSIGSCSASTLGSPTRGGGHNPEPMSSAQSPVYQVYTGSLQGSRNASMGSISSVGKTNHVTPQQVLKRNAQVFITD